MLNHVAWFVTIAALGISISLLARLALDLGGRDQAAIPVRRNLVAGLVGAGVTLVCALLVNVRWLAEVDADFIAVLEVDRRPMLASILSIVTSMGDSIPVTIVATVLASVLYVATRAPLAWLLPFLVIGEQIIQVGLVRIFDPLTIGEVLPEVVDGNTGSLPSGSVPRLFAVLAVASLLWLHRSPRVSLVLMQAAAGFVLVQAITRLYLGRHLLIDVVAGLGLSLAIIAFAHVLIALVVSRWPSARPGAPAEPARLPHQGT